MDNYFRFLNCLLLSVLFFYSRWVFCFIFIIIIIIIIFFFIMIRWCFYWDLAGPWIIVTKGIWEAEPKGIWVPSMRVDLWYQVREASKRIRFHPPPQIRFHFFIFEYYWSNLNIFYFVQLWEMSRYWKLLDLL